MAIVASQTLSHWHPSHWAVGHWADEHWLDALEIIYDTAPTECILGTFSITASILGIWDDC